MSVRDAARALRESAQRSSKKGKVLEIRRDYSDKEKVRLEIEVGRKRPSVRVKGEAAPESYPITESVLVSRAFAKGVRIGDEITVTTAVQAHHAE